ncbi:GNAT family N-acetyltransferase [Marinobacter sp. 1Y8]
MRLKVRKYSWQLAPSAVREIRQAVFIDEQAVPAELEWDDTDEISDHYIGLTPDNTPVAVARLVPSITDAAHIGRMAILKDYRGMGFGEQMLRHVIADAAPEFDSLHLSAQQYAVPFYQRAGFHVCSLPYDDAGIPHLAMRCFAARQILVHTDQPAMPTIASEDNSTWHFSSETDLCDLTDTLAGQARQRLWIYERHLDHDIYDRKRLRDLISELARSHRNAEIRILIHDDKPLVQRRHQLVELMRRLPSKIELRLVNQDYPAENQAFVIGDRESVSYRHSLDSIVGWTRFSDTGRAKLQSEAFQRMWDSARPSVELRELPI